MKVKKQKKSTLFTESELSVGLTADRKFGDDNDDTLDGSFSMKKKFRFIQDNKAKENDLNVGHTHECCDFWHSTLAIG